MATSDILKFGFSAAIGTFEIVPAREGDALVLGLSGELDVASVGSLEEAIDLAEEGSARWVVVDLTEVQFIDSTALHALLKAYVRSQQNGHRLRFLPSKHDAVTQLVAITGTSRIFD
jgi:anti-sigma B factor antagonist